MSEVYIARYGHIEPVVVVRPQTAYFLFSAAERVAVKAAQPEPKATVAKELGRRWQALSAEGKAVRGAGRGGEGGVSGAAERVQTECRLCGARGCGGSVEAQREGGKSGGQGRSGGRGHGSYVRVMSSSD